MPVERTLAIIKPDAMSRGLAGEILSRIHKAGFSIAAIKSLRLTRREAEGFYAVHHGKGFFGELTTFMSSGKIIVMVLEAEGAIARSRETFCGQVLEVGTHSTSSTGGRAESSTGTCASNHLTCCSAGRHQ